MQRVIAVMLTVSAGLLMPVGGMAMGEQKARSVIVLSCPQDVPEAQALCQKMMVALRRASPDGALVRRLQADETFEPRLGDLDVALRLDALRADHLSAHLEWRTAETPAAQKGPSVSLDVMDGQLSDAGYARLVDGMLRVTPQLFAP
jgi:hypothetical protein